MKIYILGLSFILLCFLNLSGQTGQELDFIEDGSDLNQVTPDDDEKFTTVTTTVWVLDSMDRYFYDYGLGELVFEDRTRTLTRDELGNYLMRESQFWDEDTQSFVNKDLLINNYYENGATHYFTKFPWNSELNDWAADTLTFYEKNENGDLLDIFRRAWDYQDNEFIFTDFAYYSKRYTYDLDQEGKRVWADIRRYNYDTGEWNIDGREFYSYESDGLSYEVLGQSWDTLGNFWRDKYKFLYTLNEDGQAVERVYQKYDLNSQGEYEWQTSSSYTKEYDDDGNLIDYILYSYSTGSPVPFRRHTYEYDADNNLLLDVYDKWDADTEDWVNYERREYTYDENGNELSYLSMRYFSDNWREFVKYVYYWSEIEIMDAGEALLNGVEIVPNPTSGKIVISGREDIGDARISVYSVSGQPLMVNHSNHGVVDIAKLPKGVYFLEIRTEEGRIVKKIIRE